MGKRTKKLLVREYGAAIGAGVITGSLLADAMDLQEAPDFDNKLETALYLGKVVVGLGLAFCTGDFVGRVIVNTYEPHMEEARKLDQWYAESKEEDDAE